MGPAEPVDGAIEVEVAYSPQSGQVQRLTLILPAGATVAQAMAQAVARSGWTLPEDIRVGVWGRLGEPSEPLRGGDRVELCRPLLVDPKEARRLRYRSHRAAKR